MANDRTPESVAGIVVGLIFLCIYRLAWLVLAYQFVKCARDIADVMIVYFPALAQLGRVANGGGI